MYDIDGYRKMMTDPIRTEAYARAIADVVRPGDIVLDLGAGAGLFSILAARAGAARVYAVEFDDIIEVARKAVVTSGAADQVVCIKGDSTRINLPEPADVLVCDVHGALPLFGNGLHAIADARRRHLKPGARLIPQRDILCLAPVSCPDAFASVDGWRTPICGLDYSFVAELASNEWFGHKIGAEHLLAAGHQMSPIDFSTFDSQDLSFRARFVAERAGALDGIGAWFTSDLAPGVAIDAAPDRPRTIYGQAFFPISRRIEVDGGDTIEVELDAHFIEPTHYCAWTVTILRPSGAPVVERRSELEGVLFSAERILRSAEFFTPSLNADGAIELALLDMMRGRDSLRALAERLVERFPERFARPDDAMPHVRAASRRFGG